MQVLNTSEADRRLEEMIQQLPVEQQKVEREKLSQPIATIGLSVRTTNSLEEAGVYSVGHLLMCTEGLLIQIPNLGEKTLAEIFQGLASVGYYRAGYEPSETTEQIKARRRKMYRMQFGF